MRSPRKRLVRRSPRKWLWKENNNNRPWEPIQCNKSEHNNHSNNAERWPCQLRVLGHDGNALGMNGAQVGILKQANKVSFRSFLKSKYRRALEMQIILEILSNLTNQALEWCLANQKVRRLLILAIVAVIKRKAWVSVFVLLVCNCNHRVLDLPRQFLDGIDGVSWCRPHLAWLSSLPLLPRSCVAPFLR